MPSVPAAAVTEALNWRYATKKFDPSKRIAKETWAALEQSLVLAPSSYGLQTRKLFVVDDPATRERLSAASWGQRQPVDCSHFVVFTARKNYDGADLERFINRSAEVRRVSHESLKGYAKVISGSLERARSGGALDSWMGRQVYIALGEFMTAAALLRVDTCPMEGLDPAKYDEILGLGSQGYGTLCACAAGYRASDDRYASEPKVRFKDSEVLVHI
jgi:nitroreductase